MRFLSLFSGIEAASQAWNPLGWECVGVAEIEPFPCAVLKHHFPSVPNLGSVTEITQQQIESLGKIDIVVFGFPCQDLSVAGKRKGLTNADGTHTRSGLFFTATKIIEWAKPRWSVAENVPGLLSSNEGGDFASVVGELAGIEIDVPRDGWRSSGVALGPKGLVEWTILDAQYHGLAQRRRRVFIVGDSGDWSSRPPLLFEPSSMRRNTAPSREARQGTPATAQVGTGSGGKWLHDVTTIDAKNNVDRGDSQHLDRLVPEVTGTMGARTTAGGGFGGDFETAGGLIPETVGALTDGAHNGGDSTDKMPTRDESLLCLAHGQANAEILQNQAPTLNCNHEQPIIAGMLSPQWGVFDDVAHTLRAEHDASEDGTGRGTPLIAVHGTQDPCTDENVAFALGRNNGAENVIAIHPACIGRGAASGPQGKEYLEDGSAYTHDARGVAQAVAHPIHEMATRHAGTDGSGGQAGKGHGLGIGEPEDPMFTLTKDDKHAVAFRACGQEGFTPSEIAPPIVATDGGGAGAPTMQSGMQVRRLTPVECERLQGFPDNFTLIPWKFYQQYAKRTDTGTDGTSFEEMLIKLTGRGLREPTTQDCPDGPRYRALGNSMAVPVMNWLGRQIQRVEDA